MTENPKYRKTSKRPVHGRVRSRKRLTPSSTRDTEHRTYDVGYGKPPKRTQFKPGQSGNPRGRPKGAKNSKTILRRVLDQKITLRLGDSTRQISAREGIMLRLRERALKGEPNAIKLILSIDDGFELDTSDPGTTPVRPADLEALDDAVLAEFERQLREAADESEDVDFEDDEGEDDDT